jgi:Cu/Ag efflux protein CusF
VPGFMPPMNMEYKVKDAQLVERVKSGDKIKATLVIEDHNPAQLEDVAVLGK